MSSHRDTFNVLFCGVGGQGVLSASEVCALAAMRAGYHVKKSEVKGMAQRGGSVESYVRFGSRVFSPLPPAASADVLVCLNAGEHQRGRFRLKKNGKDLLPYLRRAGESVGAQRIFINAYMLGVLSAFLPIDGADWREALNAVFKRAQDLNQQFFLKGREAGGRDDLQ